MYFYIGILTASLVVLTNAGNGLSMREKRQANANKLQAIVESGKTLTEIIKEIKGLLSDSLSAYIGDLDDEVRKIDISFDGLKAEERRNVEEAHTLLTASGTKLFLLRQTLTLLAKETIERSNRIIKVFKMVEDQPDKASKLIIYSQKKMNHLFVRSKSILKQSLDDYNNILTNLRNTKTKLESFIRHVDGLGDDDNERFKQWKKEMREKVYGGSAACVVFPPSCAIIYPAAAAILESKIKKRKEAVRRLLNAAERAEINAKNLVKQVDAKEKYVTREIELVNKWSSQVRQNSEEYASSEDILFFIEVLGQKEAIKMLCALTKASKDYIDHKLPGLEQYEITAPPLDSACSGSGTTSTPDKPTADVCQNGNGEGYSGMMSKTRSGFTCQKWSNQSPHKHRHAKLGNNNYCRNPDGEPGVWCYTTNPNKRWELCDVPVCGADDCQKGNGEDYSGRMAKTRSGFTCQKWSNQSPHKHRHAELGNNNFCRNPDGEPGVWCYTTNPNKRWELCDVPVCESGADVCQNGNGEDYSGRMSKTSSGFTCQKWSNQSPHKHRHSKLGNNNFCKNPDGEPGVWCYTTNPNKRWELCDVPVCGADDCQKGNGEGYSGRMAKTRSGFTCQRWSNQSPHKHRHAELGNNNFCRNPWGEPGVWCYTTNPNKRWELCDVPVCG